METLKKEEKGYPDGNETLLKDITVKTDDTVVVDDANLMKEWGLPKAFSANLNSSKYYCEICLVHLTSEDAYYSHLQGIQHQKTELNSKHKRRKFGVPTVENRNPLDYLKIEEDDYEGPKLFKREKKSSAKKLWEKLTETQKGYGGLKFIREIHACSSREMDAHYICQLCGFSGAVNQMFSHIMSAAHTESFLKKENVWSDIVTVEDQIEEHKENGKFDYIEIIHSDEMYPWPPGMAPWSSERNGTGIIPSSLQDGGKWFIGKKEKLSEEDKVVTFSVKNMPALKESKDVEAYLDAASEILNKAQKFHKRWVGDTDNDDTRLDLHHSLLKANIAIMKKLCGEEEEGDEIECLN